MDIRKFLVVGAGVAALSMMAACSDDSSSPSQPGPGASSVGGDTGTSSMGGVLVSSSSLSDKEAPQMACSEIMYNAPDASALEWVEIYIAGGSDMDNMQNYAMHLSGDVDYTFPAEPLKKGEYVVVTNDLALFAATYPSFTGRIFGPMTGKMVNEGGNVNVKIKGEGDVTCAFSSEPPWPSLADGKGRSLVFVGGIASQSTSWCAGAIDGGNPGVGNDACIDVVNTVRINEIKPSALVDGVGFENAWVELYNSGSTDVDVSGWTMVLKARGDTLKITSGVVPAKGYLVLDGVEGFDKELIVSDQGGEIYLFGPVSGQESSIWLPAGKDVCGMVDVSDGSVAQGPLSEATPGAKNAPLKLGSVYISEIHYHPDAKGAFPFEFIELVNTTSTPVALYNSTLKKAWKVEGIGLEFGTTDVIPANGRMILIPATLDEDTQIENYSVDMVRTTYAIPADIPIVTYPGKLSNRGEMVALKEPYSTSGTDVNKKYYYLWHDSVLYSDQWANLMEADGFGYSLQRTDVSTMGYDPSAWKADYPTLGK